MNVPLGTRGWMQAALAPALVSPVRLGHPDRVDRVVPHYRNTGKYTSAVRRQARWPERSDRVTKGDDGAQVCASH